MTDTPRNGTTAFTAQERRILAVLSDGLAHHKDELAACLDDAPYTNCATLRVNIHNIRRKLAARSQDILHKSGTYRHVVVLRYDGPSA